MIHEYVWFDIVVMLLVVYHGIRTASPVAKVEEELFATVLLGKSQNAFDHIFSTEIGNVTDVRGLFINAFHQISFICEFVSNVKLCISFDAKAHSHHILLTELGRCSDCILLSANE